MSATRIFFLSATLILSGCAAPSGQPNPKDPFEGFNRGAYRFNDTLDKAVLKPVAQGYNTVTPQAVKNMLHNFFSNLNDIVVTCNDLLQLKFVQAASDGTRVWVNSTIGVFGLINVASRLEKHNEDFGQTLGYWGVSSGPYIVIPFLGPSSVRDGAGLYVDTYPSAFSRIQDVPTRYQIYIVEGVERRAHLLDAEKVLDDTLLDRYSFIRDAYLMRRQSLVYDGDPPPEKFDEEDNAAP